MTPLSDTFARRFNEDEAIWQRFREKRLTRCLTISDSPLPESILDQFDWLEAEREIRITRAISLWSAATCRRFQKARLVAPTKALTSQRTPKKA